MGLRVLLSPNGGKPNGANNADLGQVVSLLDALSPEHVVQASHHQDPGKDAAADSSPSDRGTQTRKLLNKTTGSSMTDQDVHTYEPS